VCAQDYAELALWLLNCPFSLYKGCLKCCTGRDLDKEEAQAHAGFKSWSHVQSSLKKSASMLRGSDDKDQPEKSKHPAWRHGQKRSWQLIAMQANTQHAGALDHAFQDEALDDFFRMEKAITSSPLSKDLQAAENESHEIRLLRARVAQLEQEKLEMAHFESAQRARLDPSLEDVGHQEVQGRDTGSVQRGQDGGPEPSGESVGRGEGVLLSDPRPHHVSRVALVDTQCSDTHIPVALSTNKTHRVSPWSRIAKADIQSDTHVSSVTNVSALSRGALSREISTGTTALAHASIVVRDPTEGPLREWRGYA
jgi:hypothetical protein